VIPAACFLVEAPAMIEIDPRVDVVFKNLFGSPEHPRLTMSFVNSLLAMAGLPKAVQLTIQNPFQLADFLGQKESELDILYNDESGHQVQLEMQILRHPGLARRMLHNWTQLYQSQLLEKMAYHQHVPVVCFWILDEPLWYDDNWLHVFQCRDEKTGRILHEDLCIVTVELPVWTRWLKDQKSSIIDLEGKWLYFLTRAKGMDEEKLLATLSDPEFTEAMEVIKGYTTEQKQRHAYDMRQNYHHIVASFKAAGFDEGKLEGKLEDAQRMKAKGYSVEQIAEITGLDPARIQALDSREP
jgi:predicted transposase/invertase (TIGR01784 family)